MTSCTCRCSIHIGWLFHISIFKEFTTGKNQITYMEYGNFQKSDTAKSDTDSTVVGFKKKEVFLLIELMPTPAHIVS